MTSMEPRTRAPASAGSRAARGGSGRSACRVEAEHVGPRHHDRADERVLELEDLVDHFALFALHDAFLGAHVHQRAQLFLGQLGVGLALAPDEMHRERGQGPEGGAHGLEDDAEPGHRPAGQRQELLGVLDGEGHGQDLAEGGQDQDHADDLDQEAVAHAEDVLGQRRRQGGGADVDDRDADEERYEQVVGPLDQRRTGLARAPGELAQPGATQREVGRLRAGQNCRCRDQDRQGQQLQRELITHDAPRWQSARSRARPRPRAVGVDERHSGRAGLHRADGGQRRARRAPSPLRSRSNAEGSQVNSNS